MLLWHSRMTVSHSLSLFVYCHCTGTRSSRLRHMAFLWTTAYSACWKSRSSRRVGSECATSGSCTYLTMMCEGISILRPCECWRVVWCVCVFVSCYACMSVMWCVCLICMCWTDLAGDEPFINHAYILWCVVEVLLLFRLLNPRVVALRRCIFCVSNACNQQTLL